MDERECEHGVFVFLFKKEEALFGKRYDTLLVRIMSYYEGGERNSIRC